LKFEDLEREDSKRPDQQPKALRDLAVECWAKIKDSEMAETRQDRVAQWDRIEKILYRKDHWTSPNSKWQFKVGEQYFPKFDLIQMIVETAVPKILDQNFKPNVGVEGHRKQYLKPEDPNSQAMMQAIQDNGLEGENLPEIAQQMINPAIEFHREKEGLGLDTEKMARSMVTLGESVICDSFAGAPKSFTIHPRDAFCDEYAHGQEDITWGGYRYSKTIAEIRKDYPEWGHLAKPQAEDRTSSKSRAGLYHIKRVFQDEHDVLKSRIWVYTIWMRDLSEETITSKPVKVGSAVELNQYRLDERDWSEEPIYESGGDTPDYWLLTTKIKQQKYPSGLRQVCFTPDVVLDSGDEDKLPDGVKMPIQWAPYFPIDGTVHGTGLAEIAMEPGLALDQFWKAALEDTSYGSLTLVRENAVAAGNTFRKEREPFGRAKLYYLRSSYKGPITDAIHTMSAGETAQSIVALIGVMREFVEWLTGQYDPRMAVQGMRDASGELIKDLTKGSHDRLGLPKDTIKRVLRQLVTNWVHYLVTYDDTERNYRRETFTGGEQWVQFKPQILGKFEWNFDVQIGRGANLPEDPEEQAAYVEALIDRMSQKPKQIRDFEIDRYEIPFGDEIKKILDAAEQAAQQAAAQAGDPVAAANREAAGKELADSLGNIASNKEGDTGNRGKALGSLAEMGKSGEIPDVGWFTGEQPAQGPQGPPVPQMGNQPN